MTGFNWMPRMRPPAMQIYDLPELTTQSSDRTIAVVPVHNTDWVEIDFVVTGNPVIVTIIPDSTAGHMLQHYDVLPVGTTTCWTLVHGVLPEIPLAYGSHNVTINAKDATPGAHGTINSVMKQRVSRRN